MALFVITGPPAGGKSTFVRGRAKPGDVVIDYDLIAAALSAPHAGHPHQHPEPVKTIAYRARTAAIREALRHVATVDVYIIHSMPTPDWLDTYHQHGAEIVVIDPGHEVVMARIAHERPASARAVATRWYNQAGKGARDRAYGQGTRPPGPSHPTPPVHPPPKASRSW